MTAGPVAVAVAVRLRQPDSQRQLQRRQTRQAHVLQPCLTIPDSNDAYISNINKTLIGLRELYRMHPDARWFWLSSDDAYINVHYTLRKLQKLDGDSELLLGEGYDNGPPCVNDGQHVMYPAGGAGMIVSRALMQRVHSLIEPWLLNEWMPEKPGQPGDGRQYGDVAVGCFFAQHGVRMTWLPGHHHATPLFGADRPPWETTLSHPQAGEPHYHDEVNNWHYVERGLFFQADLFYGLQMVDRMERNGQISQLGQYAREVLAERFYQQNRSMALLWHERQN